MDHGVLAAHGDVVVRGLQGVRPLHHLTVHEGVVDVGVGLALLLAGGEVGDALVSKAGFGRGVADVGLLFHERPLQPRHLILWRHLQPRTLEALLVDEVLGIDHHAVGPYRLQTRIKLDRLVEAPDEVFQVSAGLLVLDGRGVQLGELFGEVEFELDVLLLAVAKLVVEEFGVLHEHLLFIVQLLHLDFNVVTVLPDVHALPLHSVDLLLQLSELGILQAFQLGFVGFLLEGEELVLHLEHMEPVGREEVSFILLEHLVQLQIQVFDLILDVLLQVSDFAEDHLEVYLVICATVKLGKALTFVVFEGDLLRAHNLTHDTGLPTLTVLHVTHL